MTKARKPPPILANREQHFPLAALSRLLPDKPSYSSLWLWCRYGTTGENGDTVKMESIWGTNRRVRRSSVEAYHRFIDRINGYERS